MQELDTKCPHFYTALRWHCTTRARGHTNRLSCQPIQGLISSAKCPMRHSPQQLSLPCVLRRATNNKSDFNFLIIDEISMVPATTFHHVIWTVQDIKPRPVVLLSGDATQQQTISRKTVQVPSVLQDPTFSQIHYTYNLTLQTSQWEIRVYTVECPMKYKLIWMICSSRTVIFTSVERATVAATLYARELSMRRKVVEHLLLIELGPGTLLLLPLGKVSQGNV